MVVVENKPGANGGVRTCWNDAEPVFKGEHYGFDKLHFSPKPVRSIPILIGGNSAPALRRAGALGDGWHGTRVAIRQIPDCIRAVKAAAERAGRDPSSLTFGHGVEIDILDNGGSQSSVGLYSPEQALVGSPDDIARSIQEMGAAGISQLELRFRPMRDSANTSIAPTLEMMHLFAKEILPRFRKQPQHEQVAAHMSPARWRVPIRRPASLPTPT